VAQAAWSWMAHRTAQALTLTVLLMNAAGSASAFPLRVATPPAALPAATGVRGALRCGRPAPGLARARARFSRVPRGRGPVMEARGIAQQQQVVRTEDVVEVYRLCVPRREAGADVICTVVETEAVEPEHVDGDAEAWEFDASRAVFRCFTFDDCQQVVIREVQYHMLGYGHTVWEAGIALAAWLRLPAQQQLLRDQEVLELGCGCALPGIATAQTAQARAVTLSDMGVEGGESSDPTSREGEQPWELLANVRYNAAVNCAKQAEGGSALRGQASKSVVPVVRMCSSVHTWTSSFVRSVALLPLAYGVLSRQRLSLCEDPTSQRP
jgi:hypothetical protein